MKTARVRYWIMNLLIAIGAVLQTAGAQQEDTRLEVSIKQALAGSVQEITFTYTTSEEGLSAAGGIRIEFPVAYAETEFLFWSKPQTTDPELLGYVSGRTSSGVPVTLSSYGIAGGIFQCVLSQGALKRGDRLYVSYHGQVQSLARNFVVRAEVRGAEEQAWQPVADPPQIIILPRKGETLVATAPADLVVGEPHELALVVLDKFGNRASGYRGTVTLQSSDDHVEMPQEFTFSEADSGVHLLRGIRFHTAGFQKITLKTSDALKVSSHFSWITERRGKFRRYFGDTHFHTGSGTRNRGFFARQESHENAGMDVNVLPLKSFQRLNAGGDHRGNFTTASEAYRYARDVVRLDFASASEHDGALFDEQAWEQVQGITEVFYQPGKFTTLFAYEWTPGITHHIVLYKDRGLQVFGKEECSDLPSLWQALEQQDKPALTIPHLTWNFREHTNWEPVNNLYRKIGEIYSLWNGRFLVQPGDEPQRFELGKDNKWSFQHAWHEGHRIGVVGSSDNHLGRPGANNYTIYTQHTCGLAVVLAEENNRDRLWDALQERRTYATSGTRIYLDFTVNGNPMGSQIQSPVPPVISARVAGSNRLEKIEVVKYARGSYATIYEDSTAGETSQFTFEDREYNSDCFYYLRVTQVSEVPGRLWSYPTNEMAWSSPVWVEFTDR